MRIEGCLAVWTGDQWECAVCGWTSPYDLFAQEHSTSDMDRLLDFLEVPD